MSLESKGDDKSVEDVCLDAGMPLWSLKINSLEQIVQAPEFLT